jgi:hypothetical protein
MPRFRDSFVPLIHRPQAPFQSDLCEHYPLPQMSSEFTQEKLTSLWGATPTEENIETAARIEESMRNVTTNA